MAHTTWHSVAIKPNRQQRAILDFYQEALFLLKERWFKDRLESGGNFTKQSRSIKKVRKEATYQHVPQQLIRSLAWQVEKSWLSGLRVAQPITSLEFGSKGWKIESDQLTIAKLGPIKYRGKLPTDPQKLSLVYKQGRWFAYLQVEKELSLTKQGERSVGIDLGVKTWSVLSNGMEVPQHESLFNLRTKLKKHQKDLSTKEVGSTRYEESLRRVERTKERIRACQQDRAIKHAVWLCRNFDIICIEAINEDGAGIANDPIYKSAGKEANWALLTSTIQKEAQRTGTHVVLVPAFYTSQECSGCGYYAPKPLEARTHYCKRCRLQLDRDINAARVIEKRGLLIHSGQRKANSSWYPIGFNKR